MAVMETEVHPSYLFTTALHQFLPQLQMVTAETHSLHCLAAIMCLPWKSPGCVLHTDASLLISHSLPTSSLSLHLYLFGVFYELTAGFDLRQIKHL